MKAMVLDRQGPIEGSPLRMKDVVLKKPTGHDVIIKVQACGVCHTDLHIVEGELYDNVKLPLIPGHEVVGVVEEAGEKSVLKVGDRVGVGWVASYCGECVNCKAGRDNVCLKRESTGCTVDGGYAERAKFDSRFLTKIPDGLKSEEAAPLLCAGITAYHATKLVSPKKDEKVAIVGIGGLGSYAVSFAKMAGAKVYAFSRDSNHFDIAKRMGADEAFESENISAKMREIGITAAMVFAPSSEVLEQVLMGLPRGGRALMAGGIDRLDIDYRKSLSGEKSLLSVSVGPHKEIAELLKLAADGKVKTNVSEMKLSEANEALALVKEGKVLGRIVLTNE